MDLFIQKVGVKLYKEKEHFVVEKKEENKEYFSYNIVDNIIIQEGNQITSDLLYELIEKEVNLYIADKYGNLIGKFIPITYNINTKIREKQVLFFQNEIGKELGKNWIIEKIENQKKHIRKIYSRRGILEDFICVEKKFDEEIRKIKEILWNDESFENKIMGYEGRASMIYYEEIKKFLPEIWSFTKRETQGAREPYNIVLNYAFGILYLKIEKYLTLAGLDIQLGIIHSNNNKNKSLIFDFIEPFRILAWESTFSLFSKKELNKNYFNLNDGKIELEGRKIISKDIYNRLKNIVEYNGKKISYEEKIEKRAKEIVKELMKYEIYNKL